VTATNGSPSASGPADASSVGSQLRERRIAKGMSLRQFARDLGVSPSFVSQIENGKSRPSVDTLYAICHALDLSIDELFNKAGAGEVPAASPATGSGPHSFHGALAALNDPQAPSASPVVRPDQHRRLVLDSGVTWDQLSAAHESSVDFLLVRYDVGGSSVPGEHLTRHSGTEYGYIISGTLDVSLGFDTYRVGPGDAISFDSATPHRLTNNGDVPVEAIWFVHGRNHP
jgi:DNA-binding XRE family transcriptional regulator/mannose-6-phosphate isomerase-like protein (cupin superfamily)